MNGHELQQRKQSNVYHCSLLTNLLLSLSSFACLGLNKGSILQNRKWSVFFILLGISSLLSGVGHSLHDDYNWMVISRLVMLMGMFFAINAGVELYDLRRKELLRAINLAGHITLGALLLFNNSFGWVNASVAGTFGMFIPIGIKRSGVSRKISAPMYIGIMLLVLGGLVFAGFPRSSGDDGMHVAHLIVSLGTCFIGWSLSKHIAHKQRNYDENQATDS